MAEVATDDAWAGGRELMEVCPNFTRGFCDRGEERCKFAHPTEIVRQVAKEANVCLDSLMKSRDCTHKNCRYYHPPAHIEFNDIVKGRINLCLKFMDIDSTCDDPVCPLAHPDREEQVVSYVAICDDSECTADSDIRETCTFHHLPSTHHFTKGIDVCYDYTQGKCTRGDRCKFSHAEKGTGFRNHSPRNAPKAPRRNDTPPRQNRRRSRSPPPTDRRRDRHTRSPGRDRVRSRSNRNARDRSAPAHKASEDQYDDWSANDWSAFKGKEKGKGKGKAEMMEAMWEMCSWMWSMGSFGKGEGKSDGKSKGGDDWSAGGDGGWHGSKDSDWAGSKGKGKGSTWSENYGGSSRDDRTGSSRDDRTGRRDGTDRGRGGDEYSSRRDDYSSQRDDRPRGREPSRDKRESCRDFERGLCDRGSRCRFAHVR